MAIPDKKTPCSLSQKNRMGCRAVDGHGEPGVRSPLRSDQWRTAPYFLSSRRIVAGAPALQDTPVSCSCLGPFLWIALPRSGPRLGPNDQWAIRSRMHPSTRLLAQLRSRSLRVLGMGVWFNDRRLLEPIGNIRTTEEEANVYAGLETEDLAA